MWLLILISALLLVILLKITINNSSWNTITFDIIRSFTLQNVYIFKFQKIKIQNKTTLIITMIILIFFTVIITKCFTSLLLNTYFKLIKVPYVESLEQLIDGNHCLIACLNRTIHYLKDFKVFEEKQIEVLREKKEKYEQIGKKDVNYKFYTHDEKVFNDIVDGKTILMENTFTINYFIETYKRERNRFVVSEHKYINLLAGHPINKQSFIKELQIFGFVFIAILLFTKCVKIEFLLMNMEGNRPRFHDVIYAKYFDRNKFFHES